MLKSYFSVVFWPTGIWRISLEPVDAGGPYNVTAAVQNSTATLTDVLFGDIWLCGGQSNMYFETSQVSQLYVHGMNSFMLAK